MDQFILFLTTSLRSLARSPGNDSVEGEDGHWIQSSDDASETAPHAGPFGCPQEARWSDSGMPADGLQDLCGERNDSSGSQLPISQVGSAHQPIDPGQEDTHQPHQDGSALGRAIGNVSRQGVGGTFPCSSIPLGSAEDRAMAPATQIPSEAIDHTSFCFRWRTTRSGCWLGLQ